MESVKEVPAGGSKWGRTAVVLGAISMAMILASCGSKKKKGDVGGAPDGSIATSDMSFDPMGSDSGKISGLGSINFDYDQASLTSQARQILAQNAEWIRANGQVVVQIEGHCDSRGSTEYNLALGERRAISVKNYLVSLGVDSSRLTVISYGEEKPIDAADSEQAYARNRRANFVPIPR